MKNALLEKKIDLFLSVTGIESPAVKDHLLAFFAHGNPAKKVVLNGNLSLFEADVLTQQIDVPLRNKPELEAVLFDGNHISIINSSDKGQEKKKDSSNSNNNNNNNNNNG